MKNFYPKGIPMGLSQIFVLRNAFMQVVCFSEASTGSASLLKGFHKSSLNISTGSQTKKYEVNFKKFFS
jgi:hypothetical protein